MLVYYLTAGLLVGLGFLVFKTFLHLPAALAASAAVFTLAASFPAALVNFGGFGTLLVYAVGIALAGGAVILLQTRTATLRGASPSAACPPLSAPPASPSIDGPAASHTPLNDPVQTVTRAAAAVHHTPATTGKAGGTGAAPATAPSVADPEKSPQTAPAADLKAPADAPPKTQAPQPADALDEPVPATRTVPAPEPAEPAEPQAAPAHQIEPAADQAPAAAAARDAGARPVPEPESPSTPAAMQETPAEALGRADAARTGTVPPEPDPIPALTITEQVSRALRLAKEQDYPAAVRLLQNALRQDPSPYLSGLIAAELSSIYQRLGQYWMAREILRVFLARPGADKHLLNPILREKLVYCEHLIRLLRWHNLGEPPYDRVPEEIKREALSRARKGLGS